MNLKFAVVIAIGLAITSQAGAQRVASNAGIGVARRSSPEFRAVDSGSSARPSRNARDVAFRVFTSAIVATGAGLIAGRLGASMEGSCSCDDPGLGGAILGVLTGLVVGAPLGAAAPTLGSTCTFNERFGRSFVGSLAGTAVGVLAATTLHSPIGLLAVPVFAAGGGVASLGPCLKSRAG